MKKKRAIILIKYMIFLFLGGAIVFIGLDNLISDRFEAEKDLLITLYIIIVSMIYVVKLFKVME